MVASAQTWATYVASMPPVRSLSSVSSSPQNPAMATPSHPLGVP